MSVQNLRSISSTIESQANGEIGEAFPIQSLPEELIVRVFSNFNMNELGRNSRVCRTWSRLCSEMTLWNVFDLRTLSPSIKVWDESDWETHVDMAVHGLSTEDLPPLDKSKTIPVLKRCLFSLPIEDNKGITLLTIPAGLTINKLLRIAAAPKMGNITPIRFIWFRILDEMGDIAVDQTYRIVISNNILVGSRYQTFKAQQELTNKNGSEVPKLLEAMVLCIVTFMSSGERLYNDAPWTYSRCVEQLTGYEIVVGGFAPAGVCLSHYHFASDGHGVAAVFREF